VLEVTTGNWRFRLTSYDSSVTEVSGHEIAKSFDCATPGCTGSARAKTGRHAYCDPCRIARGTALPDGSPIESKIHVTSRRKKGRAAGPFEERVYGLLDAARNLDLQVERYRLARPALEQAVAAWRAALADVASIDARSISAAASRNGDS
jgi:hypothetical protein